ncbi:MAG: hypothetical protein MZV63_57450 [Marinilabiliales bacterium]|nr:hypothetical protein [Marinilabiliales bacterium]
MPRAESPEFTMESKGFLKDLRWNRREYRKKYREYPQGITWEDVDMIFSQAGGSAGSALSSTANVRNENEASIKVFLKTKLASETEECNQGDRGILQE